MTIIQVKPSTGCVSLGKQGENLVRRLVFDLSDWQQEFGDGTPVLIHAQNGDELPHPVDIENDGAFVYWDILSSDTAVAGYGKCELSYHVGEAIVKSDIYHTVVEPSMADDVGDPPEDIDDWFDAANLAIEEAKTATEDAKNAAKLATDAAQNADGESVLASDEDFNEMFTEVFGEGPDSEAS